MFRPVNLYRRYVSLYRSKGRTTLAIFETRYAEKASRMWGRLHDSASSPVVRLRGLQVRLTLLGDPHSSNRVRCTYALGARTGQPGQGDQARSAVL